MNINSPFPYDVDALIECLGEIYPDRSPDLDDPDRVIWMKAGQSSVVAFLKAWRKASLEKQPSTPATTAGMSSNQTERTKGSVRRRAGRATTAQVRGRR